MENWKSHAQIRASQRYNKELTEKDITCIKAYIHNNEHTPLGTDPNVKSKKFCYVTYNHIPYKVLYTIRHKQVKIITIYPFDFEEYNKIQEQKKKEKIEKAIKFLEKEGYIVSN